MVHIFSAHVYNDCGAVTIGDSGQTKTILFMTNIKLKSDEKKQITAIKISRDGVFLWVLLI